MSARDGLQKNANMSITCLFFSIGIVSARSVEKMQLKAFQLNPNLINLSDRIAQHLKRSFNLQESLRASAVLLHFI